MTDRLVRMSEEFALQLGASRVEWGEPDANGVYTPTLYRDNDRRLVSEAELAAALEVVLEHEEVDCDPEGNKFHTTCDHDEQALHFVAAILAAWANLGETVQEVVKSAALSGAAQEKGETG